MTLVWTCQTNTAEKFLGGLNTEDLIFNWHPFLMVLGLCSFLTNGITAYRTTGMTHAHAKVAHVTWYVFSFLSAMLGLTAVFKSHERSVTANMYSLHSWIGIGAIALFGLNFVCGLFCFWNPLYVTSVSLRDAYKSYHIFGGILAFSFALVAIETGLLEKNTFLGLLVCLLAHEKYTILFCTVKIRAYRRCSCMTNTGWLLTTSRRALMLFAVYQDVHT